MNFLRTSSKFFQFNKISRRLYCKSFEKDALQARHKRYHEVFIKTFGLPGWKVSEIMAQYPHLSGNNHSIEDIQASADFLLEKKFTRHDLVQRPLCLLINRITLENRVKVLEECCFKEIQLLFLYRFVSVINREVKMMKAFNYIDREQNVLQNLLKVLDVPVKLNKVIDDDISLNGLREIVMNQYLKARLGMTNEDINKLWKVYARLRHRSLDSIVKVIDLLLNKLNFSKERIIKNGFLLYASSENIDKIISTVPTIANVPMKEFIFQRPKVAMQNAESIEKIVNHVKSFDIPEDRILKCVEILTLGPETVYERLMQLTKVKEFNVLCGHPRILRLIHYQNKAKTRLEYLKQMKVKCASLHVLSATSETFEKYARDGIDRTKGRDIVHYMAKLFKKEREDVRKVLSRHPNWCHVPVLSIKSSLDYLVYKKFSFDEIAENMILLLYPVPRIEQKLAALIEWKDESDDNRMISGVALSAISKSKLLNLCLYFIESEFHFSGDGIWDMNRHDVKQHDVFPTTIPEFPKTLTKVYRYGKKDQKAQITV